MIVEDTLCAEASKTHAGETLVDIAMRRAQAQGACPAFTYLTDGVLETHRLSYAELDASAREIAAGLLSVAKPGDRVLLVYESGLDFIRAFFGALYAGLIAVPIPAPAASHMKATPQRVKAVVADCQAALLLGNTSSHALLRSCGLDAFLGGDVPWIDTEQFTSGPKLVNVEPPTPETLAYLQYTSGSTSTPKGVMITHANLMRHLGRMRQALEYDASSVSVSWMPHFHDYGLIEGILMPVFNGTPAYLMSAFAFLKRPVTWLEAISTYRGTHTQGPNFAYRYCVRRIRPDQCGALDLGSLRAAGNAAEPIHPTTSEEFHSKFAPFGLRREALCPAYGLAEATLLVTTTPMNAAPSVCKFDGEALSRGEVILLSDARSEGQSVSGCGRPLPETEVAIVDPDTKQRMGPGKVGEVWVRSEGVAAGYWDRPDESAQTFRVEIAGKPGRTYLQTGDLGFLHADQLYITARAKDLIILHGLNHHPQDIEWTVQQAHPALRADHGAAFGIDVNGEERLAVVQELERAEYSSEEFLQIAQAMVQAVADYHGAALHSITLIKRGSLPKTSSGKIQRHAARDSFLAGSLKSLLEWPIEQAVIFGTKVISTSTAPRDNKIKMHSHNPIVTERGERSARKTDELLGWLRHYAEHRLHSRLIDERRCIPPQVMLDFGNRGLFGLQAPTEYGGLDLTHHDSMRLYEQLGAIDLTLGTFLFLHNTNGCAPILRFARPALRDELMPLLASGRELAAFALSEPGAGSHLGGLTARATPDGDHWRLEGVKRWNGSAWAGVISVFARMVDAQGRLRGLTGFVVRQSEPGLRMGPEALTMGVRGIMQNALYLEGVLVASDRVIGEVGRGTQVTEHVLSHGRIALTAVALGGIERCAQLILRYASRREIETGLLLHNPQTMLKISALIHRAEVARESLSRCVLSLDGGNAVTSEVAMALKVSATDTLNFAADLLMQTLGGRGYMENNLAPQIFRDARMLSIGEGANEGLTAAIGRGARLTNSLINYLNAHYPDGAAANRLKELTEFVSRLDPPEVFADHVLQAWRDFLLGRLTCSLLELAAAQSLAQYHGNEETARWAQSRFDALYREIAQGAKSGGACLPSERIQERIHSYTANIGDVEPLAPDIEFALDPLLRRDGP